MSAVNFGGQRQLCIYGGVAVLPKYNLTQAVHCSLCSRSLGFIAGGWIGFTVALRYLLSSWLQKIARHVLDLRYQAAMSSLLTLSSSTTTASSLTVGASKTRCNGRSIS